MNPYRNFFQKYHKKITDLKAKLQDLSQKEEVLERETPHEASKKEIPEVRVVFSIDSVFKATCTVLLVFGLVTLIGFIKGTIIVFLVALFLSAAFNPAVDWLHQYHIPRWLGILLMYAVVLGTLVLLLTQLVPLIADQIGALAVSIRDMILNLISGNNPNSWFMVKLQPITSQIRQYVDQAQVISTLTDSLNTFAARLTSFAGNAIGAIFAIFNGLLNLMLVLIITFFMVVNNQHTSHFFYSLFPRKYSDYLSVKAKQMSVRIGEWIRGQILLALTMAVLSFAVFSIIHLNFALTLSMVAAIGEFIPYLGPLITFFAAVLIAVNQSPALILWLIPAYFVIQFIESNILAPLIIGKSLGMNPIIVMFALLAGGTLGLEIGDSYGLALVGMIIAVPLTHIVSIFVEDYAGKNK